MKRMAALLALLVCSALTLAQTPIETEQVKELKPSGSLGTCAYKPAGGETQFYEKLAPEERATGSFMEDYDIHGKKGYVSWYGIVRGISRTKTGVRLLLEHKYFDALTDCHIMLVSMRGSGDFLADVEVARTGASSLPAPLQLVRIYGTIAGPEDSSPVVKAEYMRVWPWMTFTFTDLGAKDRGNSRWRAACKICKARIYRPYPDETYYRNALGDPHDYPDEYRNAVKE